MNYTIPPLPPTAPTEYQMSAAIMITVVIGIMLTIAAIVAVVLRNVEVLNDTALAPVPAEEPRASGAA